MARCVNSRACWPGITLRRRWRGADGCGLRWRRLYRAGSDGFELHHQRQFTRGEERRLISNRTARRARFGKRCASVLQTGAAPRRRNAAWLELEEPARRHIAEPARPLTNPCRPDPCASAARSAGSDDRRQRSRLGSIGIPSKHLIQNQLATASKTATACSKSSSCGHPNIHATVFA